MSAGTNTAENTVQERAEVPEAERWNARSVFATPEDWETAFAALGDELADAGGFPGTLLASPEALTDWFTYQEGVLRTLGKLRVYATMDYATNAQDSAAKARQDRVRGVAALVQEAFAFARPELLAADAGTLTGWLAAHPPLASYRHHVERLFAERAHTRSAEVEALLGALSDPFGTATSAHGVLADSELDFGAATDSAGGSHPITQGTIRTLLGSSDRALRQSAFERYADAHLAVEETTATILAAGVKQNVFLARARRYGSALEAALAPENLPLSVFHTLLETFQAKLPIWHRYWRAKARLLKLDKLAPYDVQASLSENGPHVPYEQSVAWLAEAMAPLGQDYVRALTRGSLEDGWVDRAVNRGKRMGAFSSGSPDTHPFIMMSYTDDLLGMSTLAHELGHSLHSYYAWRAQPFVYARYSLFVAEVASNFNQAMLRAHLFERDLPRDFELSLIEEGVANFYRYFFIMPTLARFELWLHEETALGEPLPAARLNARMAELFAEGYGDGVALDEAGLRERVGVTWAQFHTHLYSRFYVYQYATGISGAHALAARVRAREPGAAERYLDFLKAGGSVYPLDALRAAGVDLSTPQPIEETFGVLSELVDRLEALAG